MEKGIWQRSWISPVTAVAFVGVAVTGVLMLCEVRGPIKPLHEWMGLVLAIAGCIHLIINWRPLMKYFDKRSARIAAGVALALSALLLAAGMHGGPPEGEGHHGRDHGGMMLPPPPPD